MAKQKVNINGTVCRHAFMAWTQMHVPHVTPCEHAPAKSKNLFRVHFTLLQWTAAMCVRSELQAEGGPTSKGVEGAMRPKL